MRYVSIVVGEHPLMGEKHISNIVVDYAEGRKLTDKQLLDIVSRSSYNALHIELIDKHQKKADGAAMAAAAVHSAYFK